MAGKFRRIESGAMWLATLAGGAGVTLMTAGFRWLGLLFSIVGLLIFAHRFWGDFRRVRIVLILGDGEEAYVKPSTEFLLALIIIPAVALVAVYIFLSSGPLSQAVTDSRSNEERVTTEQSSLSLGKYVCTTSLSVGSGKYALLVEFGVHRGQTNGFYGQVDFVSPYTLVKGWTWQPLRKDKPGMSTVMFRLRELLPDPTHLRYAEKFLAPLITPQESYYLYFEADQPLQVKGIFFVEDYYALSDQVRANTLAKQWDTCPR